MLKPTYARIHAPPHSLADSVSCLHRRILSFTHLQLCLLRSSILSRRLFYGIFYWTSSIWFTLEYSLRHSVFLSDYPTCACHFHLPSYWIFRVLHGDVEAHCFSLFSKLNSSNRSVRISEDFSFPFLHIRFPLLLLKGFMFQPRRWQMILVILCNYF